MSDTQAKRERIKAKVAASQQRLTRSSDALPPVPKRVNLPDAYPPEDYRSLAAEYPGLTVAAGLGFGLLIGAIVPKGLGGKLGKRVIAAATVASELSLALGKQARDAAAEKGHDGLSRARLASAPLQRGAERISRGARQSARSAGLAVAREAIKLATRSRKGE